MGTVTEVLKRGRWVVPTAQAELAAQGFRPGQRVDLSVEAQHELVALCRQAKALRQVRPRRAAHERLLAQADRYVAALLGSVRGLVETVLREKHLAAHPDADDLRQELIAIVLSAIDDWDPRGGTSWASWVTKKMRWQLSDLRRGELPRVWWRVLRSRDRVEGTLAQRFGRHPSHEEIVAEVRAEWERWAETNLPVRDQHLTGDARSRARERKLREDGVLAAIAALPRADAVRTPVSLDATDEDGHGLADVLEANTDEPGDVERWYRLATGGLPPALAAAVAEWMAGRIDDPRLTYEEVASRHGMAPVVLRRAVSRARRRISSPIVQWAYLGPEPPIVELPAR